MPNCVCVFHNVCKHCRVPRREVKQENTKKDRKERESHLKNSCGQQQQQQLCLLLREWKCNNTVNRLGHAKSASKGIISLPANRLTINHSLSVVEVEVEVVVVAGPNNGKTGETQLGQRHQRQQFKISKQPILLAPLMSPLLALLGRQARWTRIPSQDGLKVV